MRKQGPGTKLVLKGLKRALPDIAERHERDLEERDSRRRQSKVRESREQELEEQKLRQHKPASYEHEGEFLCGPLLYPLHTFCNTSLISCPEVTKSLQQHQI